MGGIFVIVAGIWVIAQVVGGDALGRLGLADTAAPGVEVVPPGGGTWKKQTSTTDDPTSNPLYESVWS